MVPPTLIVGLAAVVIVAGAINGVAGFGFALVGTTVLATVLDPATAVVFMILPILAVNLSLVGELSVDDLRSCGRRFGPLLLSALLGTALGMVLLDRLPEDPLEIGLGVVALGFVATAQRRVPIPGLAAIGRDDLLDTPAAMVGVGGVSGLLFGATNVGVQLVAYLRSRELSHGLFVGVVAATFLGINGLRVVIAGAIGLYPDVALAASSLMAAIPAVIGVWIGKRLRDRVRPSHRRLLVLGLIAVVGVRLLVGGIGIA